jgi:hypothetical protein
MKHLLKVIVLLFLFENGYSQNEYYDAKILAAYVSPVNNKFSPEGKQLDTILNIFKKYKYASKSNPFLDSFLTTGQTSSFNDHGVDFNNVALPSLASFGSVNVTNIVDGLAKFLVQRTKEELSVAFFAQLKKDFKDPRFITLQTLFPRTWHELDLIGEKIYQFSTYLTDLRTAFIADLEDLPKTLPFAVNLPPFKNYFAARPWVRQVVATGLFISQELLQKDNKIRNLGEVIESLNQQADVLFPATGNDINAKINGTIKTFSLFSVSLRSTDASRYWISGSEILDMVSNPIIFKIYLGLLYQSAGTISFGTVKLRTVFDKIAKFDKTLEATNKYISSLGLQLNLFDEGLKKILEDNARIVAGDVLAKDEKITHCAALFNTATDIVQSGLSFAKEVNDDIPGNTKLDLPAGFFDSINEYTRGLHDISNIYLYISQKNYPLAITATADFFDVVLHDKKGGDVVKFIQRLNTYGTFIGEVANAKSSDQVDSIIDKTVLPTGSSYIKKHSRFNVALQAYTGLYVGNQRQVSDAKFVGAAGVYAPIGVAVSWGIPRHNIARAPHAFSVFASIVDIGAFVSFRFKNTKDTIANSVNVKLSQIISPGIHLVYGIPTLPISIGVGCNWSPLITDVEKDAIKTMPDNKSAFRYQAFIAVDIPLLNFHNKPR